MDARRAVEVVSNEDRQHLLDLVRELQRRLVGEDLLRARIRELEAALAKAEGRR